MSAEVIRFPPRSQPRSIEPLPLVTTQTRELDPAAWGFPSREAMEAAWAAEDQGPEVA